MYAIAGVSGHTGSVAARTLLSQGKKVRVIVRDAAKGESWKAQGAEVAVADIGDTAALTKALTGVEGAYFLLPPNPAAPDPVAVNHKASASIAAAIKASGLPHVVLLSSIGAQHAAGTGPIATLYKAEQDFAATGAGVTAVRAAYFQENNGGSLGTLESGTVYTFFTNELRVPEVSTTDIGKTVAAALVEGAPKGTKRVIELSGPTDVTNADLQAALTKIVGKPVTVVGAPLDAVVPTFTGFGMSTKMAESYREMYEGIQSGHVAWEGGSARAVRGSVPLEETLRTLLGR